MTCDCGCDADSAAPGAISNRAGLHALSYRSGTWSDFRTAMLNALSTIPELGALRTRDTDDFTIALLDSWAVACDILTFYAERIANESYLRTATETLSLTELAKLIGYRRRPGVAASAALAFTMDAPPTLPPGPSSPATGMPRSVVLPAGTRSQTVPDPGNQPATFETVEPITARPQWNAMRVRTRLPYAAAGWKAATNPRLAGVAAPVQPGDELLVTAQGADWLSRVAAVVPDPATQTTVVHFEADAPSVPAPDPTTPGTADPTDHPDDTFVWSRVRDHLWSDQTQLTAFVQAQGWDVDDLEGQINSLATAPSPGLPPPTVVKLGITAGLFGNNALDWNALPAGSPYPDWSNYTVANLAVGTSLDLDATYPLSARGRAVFTDPTTWGPVITDVTAVAELTRSGFAMSGKVSRVTFSALTDLVRTYGMRTTRVSFGTDTLAVVPIVDETTVTGSTVVLDAAYLSLQIGQQVALTGVRTDRSQATGSEVATIIGLSLVDGYTTLTLSPPIQGSYRRSTVTLNANVALATHGQSTSEILGSGDAGIAFARFPLRQPPLTYVDAATATGTASTLTVRVDGVAWTEVGWLSGSGPTDRVFTVAVDVDGATYVQFGDGVTGARPGSGTNNIVASYRHGIGSGGLARPGQISTLMTRPLGLGGVTNPLPSSGAADPETIDATRTSAPMTVRCLDRIVSLSDVGDFAASSAGVAKAGVDWVWDGTRYAACATVAGVAGAPIPPSSGQYKNLVSAILNAGDGTLPIDVCSFVSVTFNLAATITVDPSLVATDVLAAVKAALRAAFGFEAGAFGAPVFASQVIDVMQRVPGVVALTLDGLAKTGDPLSPPAQRLSAAPASIGPAGLLVGSELLTIDPGPLPQVVTA